MSLRTILRATERAGSNGHLSLPNYTAVPNLNELDVFCTSIETPAKKKKSRSPSGTNTNKTKKSSSSSPARRSQRPRAPSKKQLAAEKAEASGKRKAPSGKNNDQSPAKRSKTSPTVKGTSTEKAATAGAEDVHMLDMPSSQPFKIYDDNDDSTLSEHNSDEFREFDREDELLDNITVDSPDRKRAPVKRSRKSPTKTAAKKTPVRKAAPRSGSAALATPTSLKRSQPNALLTPPATNAVIDASVEFTTSLLLKVDPRLIELSKKLEKRESLSEKPLPVGNPEVWAASRQALCETVPYFKSPQGGCYMNDGHVYGFLFDSIGHCREYMDPDLIICRAGGGMEMDADGNMLQRKDQSTKEAQPIAIMNDIQHKNPLIVICGNRNVKAVCKMPHQYCVLHWFKPAAVWAEKTAGKGRKRWVTVKYRLERLNADTKPAWNTPADWYSATGEDRKLAGELSRSSCDSCGHEYPQIYLLGWMCLNAECEDFWKVDGRDVDCGTLLYNPAFILHRGPRWAAEGQPEVEPAPLRPQPPKIGEAIGENLSYINTRGICCPQCGRCNSRRLFRGWVCETAGCQYTLFPAHKPVVPTMLHTPWESAPTLVRNRFNGAHGVKLEVWNQDGYKLCKYTFEGVNGCFIHAAPNPGICSEAGGADEMLANLQTDDMGLERRTFAVKKLSAGQDEIVPSQGSVVEPFLLTPPAEATLDPGALEPDDSAEAMEPSSQSKTKHEFEEGDLMTAFSMNYGMPYKFVASGASRSFEGAPTAVINARARLNWAARAFLNDPAGDKDFNEELIFAYLQGQKIEYHDDGESGLGPRIATLSLGGRAQMFLRVKQKHYVGCSKTGLLTDDEPLPCSIGGEETYRRRRLAWEEIQELKLTDRAAFSRRKKEIPLEIGIFEKRTKKAPDLVSVTLSHGDVVIMDGYDIQKYMEHKIVPQGYLRFALTCRSVLGDHLKPEELPPYEVRAETEAERYNGPYIE